ncbi:isochorismate synthase DhbC [Paenibacillus sp. HWE-109]|uniref:isochorismate synthase DhbC n=1 Tax=Paenibacillus sp. HWE-109 TaxID=1306526 RepID=UPI001EDD880C|nr:isochorismate synthase DhbC [Paenibacillus sp. HWE-109]UKS24696.1 isochorismate synthase DhbC [Paenibacillus sp. HWE-109]
MKTNIQLDREVVAADLLADYQPGSSFFFASPRATLLAQGTIADLPESPHGNELQSLPERAARLLAHIRQPGQSVPMLVGAVPFDPMQPAQLVVPMTTRKMGPLQFEPHERVRRPIGSNFETVAIPSAEGYVSGVEKALKRLRSGELDKIVLARSLKLTSPNKVDLRQLLRNLAVHNTHGYTFAVDLPKRVEGNLQAPPSIESRTLIGASPELLVSRSGREVVVNPLAGSAPRSEDPIEDARRAKELLVSPKDLREHALVIEAVAEALRPFCHNLDVPQAPSLVQTATMWHLSTELRGELTDPSVTSLALAVALHPTPAVCGSPTALAREAIREIEPFDRGFYTGLVGWCDASGDGEWIITIRCAVAESRSLQLYAGAGVVAESSAESELQETTAKFRTMLHAMGINHES